MSTPTTVQNPSRFAVKRKGGHDMRFPITENLNEADFSNVINKIISSGDTTQLASVIPRNSPMKLFHLQDLLKLARARKELILMVKNFIYNYRSEVTDDEMSNIKNEIDYLYNSLLDVNIN